MSPEVSAELARIRRLPDPPSAPAPVVRRCAWSGCGEPLARRAGEQPNDFAKRACCNADHGRKRGGELCRGKGFRIGPRP